MVLELAPGAHARDRASDRADHRKHRTNGRDQPEHRLGCRFGCLGFRRCCVAGSRAWLGFGRFGFRWRGLVVRGRLRGRGLLRPAALARVGHVKARPLEHDRSRIEDAGKGPAASRARVEVSLVKAVPDFGDSPALGAFVIVKRHAYGSIPGFSTLGQRLPNEEPGGQRSASTGSSRRYSTSPLK